MLLLDLLAAATPASVPAPPTRLEPVELFLDADIVVQAVMAGLLLASIWSWMIIISFALFPKPLNWQYVVGFAVVCASIYLTTKAKKIKREQKALAGGA